MAQEAELHGNTQSIRTGAVHPHELLIGGSERVKILVLSRLVGSAMTTDLPPSGRLV